MKDAILNMDELALGDWIRRENNSVRARSAAGAQGHGAQRRRGGF